MAIGQRKVSEIEQLPVEVSDDISHINKSVAVNGADKPGKYVVTDQWHSQWKQLSWVECCIMTPALNKDN